MTFVLAVSGSPAPVSKSARLAEHVCASLSRTGIAVRHLPVRELPPHALMAGDARDPAIVEAVDLVARADGVVIVTPTYKASYSGLLKTFLDVLPQHGLAGKAALPLAVGGSVAHVLMLDYALRPVLQSLGVRHAAPGYFLIESALDLASAEFVVDPAQRDLLEQTIAQFERAVSARSRDASDREPKRRTSDWSSKTTAAEASLPF